MTEPGRRPRLPLRQDSWLTTRCFAAHAVFSESLARHPERRDRSLRFGATDVDSTARCLRLES
jgi:hypothetical protein